MTGFLNENIIFELQITTRIMKILNYRSFLSLLALMVFQSTAWSQNYVHANGKAIVEGNGDTLIIRAMGVGGWMVQEGYMLQTASFASPQHKIKDTIEALIGSTATDAFYDAWLTNHFSKADVDSLAVWGFNSIRIPMHYNLFTLPIEDEPIQGQNTWLTKGFYLLDSAVEWSRQNDLYVILDLHAAPGGQGYDSGISDYDPTKPSLWESAFNRSKTAALWKKLAERYATDTVIAGYDLINEPNWNLPGGTALRAIYEDITDSIRSVDTNHIIFIEGNWFANTFTGLTPPWDNNMAYSPHKYWSPVNSTADIQYGLDLRDTYGVPIWFGETGENSNAWYTGLIEIMENNGVGWAWWPLKKIETINAPLSITKSTAYQGLLNYWSGQTSTPPSVASATATLMQLTTDLKAENCTYNRGVIDAMFRQINDTVALPWKDHYIPGVIHASEYDMGPIGVAYYDTESYQLNPPSSWNSGWTYRNDGVDIENFYDQVNDNGYKVGFIDTDDWMNYTVNVAEDSVYTINVRQGCSGSTGGNFYFEADGVRITPNYYTTNTGSWNIMANKAIPNVILSKSDRSVKFVANGGGFNVTSFEFIATGSTSSITAEYVYSRTRSSTWIEVQTNKPVDSLNLGVISSYAVTVNGSAVSVVQLKPSPNNSRSFLVEVGQAMTFLDEIKISYSGTSLKAVDGTLVQTFTLELVENLLPTVQVIPGKIEAEAYTSMQGISVENTSDLGGGQNIGYLDQGDFIIYDVKVLNSNSYEVLYRHASESQGALQLQLLDTSGALISNLHYATLLSTGGWQNWQTTSFSTGPLTAGDYKLKVDILQAPFNLNWLEFVPSINITEIALEPDHGGLRVYPNPSVDRLTVQYDWDPSLTYGIFMYDLGGKLWYKMTEQTMQGPLELSTSNIPNGSYVITVTTADGKRFSKQVLVLR